MNRLLTCGIAACLALSACSGVSTGVRSPCYERGDTIVTRGLSFTAEPIGTSAENMTPAVLLDESDDCDFQDF